MTKIRPFRLQFLLSFFIVFLLSGCFERAPVAGDPLPVVDETVPTERSFAVAPQEMESVILSVIESDRFLLSGTRGAGGRIETSWEEHSGAWRGLLICRRQYDARTRFAVEVTPVMNSPEGPINSRVSVEWLTQERPNENYQWSDVSSDPSDYGMTRALELLNAIEDSADID